MCDYVGAYECDHQYESMCMTMMSVRMCECMSVCEVLCVCTSMCINVYKCQRVCEHMILSVSAYEYMCI